MKKSKTRRLKLIAVAAIPFVAGIALGMSYQWYKWSIFPVPFFVTAADNAAPAEGAALSSDLLTRPAPPASSFASSPQTTPEALSKVPALQPTVPASTPAHNAVAVLRPVMPPAAQPHGANSLTLPQAQQSHQTETIPAVGVNGRTIWVPRAIEGCWQGSGDSSIEYLGGCPNLVSGRSTPIQLRWCFRRMGEQPLTLTMAHGHYGGRVAQRWDVMGARGETIELRETISYMTMMFLHVVDVGYWTCRITPSDELRCNEHELARCGPTAWMQPPWFRASGWVVARRAGR